MEPGAQVLRLLTWRRLVVRFIIVASPDWVPWHFFSTPTWAKLRAEALLAAVERKLLAHGAPVL